MAGMVLFGCFYWLFIFVKRAGKLKKNAKEGSAMSNEDEFFAEMHPQIAQVIGIAVMQLLVEKREPSREALIEMIQVLWLLIIFTIISHGASSRRKPLRPHP